MGVPGWGAVLKILADGQDVPVSACGVLVFPMFPSSFALALVQNGGGERGRYR